MYDFATHHFIPKFHHAVHLVFCSSASEDRHICLTASNRNIFWEKDRNAANRLRISVHLPLEVLHFHLITLAAVVNWFF